MFIDCDCSAYVDEQAEFDRIEMRKARKQHKCGECQRVIEPGEIYEICVQLYDGSWDTNKTCLGCKRIRDHLCPNGWFWGQVAEHVEDCIGFNYVAGGG